MPEVVRPTARVARTAIEDARRDFRRAIYSYFCDLTDYLMYVKMT